MSASGRTVTRTPSWLRDRPIARTIGAILPMALVVVAGAVVLWMAAPTIGDALGGHTMTESLRALALAAIPAVIVVQYDHYKTINEVKTEVMRLLETMIDGRQKYGLKAFHAELDYDSQVFATLQPHEELLWLDTYCPTEGTWKPAMLAALRRQGVKMRILAIDAACENASHRAREITADAGERAVNFHEMFAKQNELFQSDLVTSLVALERDDASVRSRAEMRLYSDLPCVPMYIVRGRDGKPTRGYSSMFLSRPTARFPHLEWTATEDPDAFLFEMDKYFTEKWERQEVVLYPTPQTHGLLEANSTTEQAAVAEMRRLVEDGRSTRALVDEGSYNSLVNIRIAEIASKGDLTYYVAELGKGARVAPHVHRSGNEYYYIAEGTGAMDAGPVAFETELPTVRWQESSPLKAGGSFLVREGWAHSLANVGDGALTLLFAAPRSHMVDNDEGGDRLIVQGANDTGVPPSAP